MTIQKHPAYKAAIDRITEIFLERGYGAIVTDEEFDAFMSIKKPEDHMSYEAFQKFTLDRLQRYRAIEALLSDHNICLMRREGVGFEILHPRDQVTKAANKHLKKVARHMATAMKSLTNVLCGELSIEENAARELKVARLAFMRAAMAGRKLHVLTDDDKKALKK